MPAKEPRGAKGSQTITIPPEQRIREGERPDESGLACFSPAARRLLRWLERKEGLHWIVMCDAGEAALVAGEPPALPKNTRALTGSLAAPPGSKLIPSGDLYHSPTLGEP